MSASRPTYSHDQIASYLDRLQLPPHLHQYDVANLDPPAALAYLAMLQKHHLAWIPFENLSLHYSAHHRLCLHPDHLFRKIIADANGRGGYCMENNTLFGTLLRSLGFTLYPTAGRVLEGASWNSLGHMVNLVTIGNTTYLVDVGFGADGPVRPMPLDRSAAIHPHIRPGSARLDWRNLSENTDPAQRAWVYECRRNDDSDWEPVKYAFTGFEFLPQDFAALSQHLSTSPRTFFTRTIVVERKILDDQSEVVGRMTLSGSKMKWRIHGQLTREIVFASEEERVDALDRYWGITLGAVEREGIRGLVSEIR